MSESAIMTVLSYFEQHFVPIVLRGCAVRYHLERVGSFGAVGG